MNCMITHEDTCLPDFAQRSYSVAIPVDGAMTVRDVIEALRSDDPLGCDDWTDAQHVAYDVAIDRLFADNVKTLDKPFDASLDLWSDDDQGDSVYAYFDVSFDE